MKKPLKIDTFSANSLKILEKDKDEFILKYQTKLILNKGNSKAKKGQNLHSFLCYYLKGFDIEKIENSFSDTDKNFIENIKTLPEIAALKNAQNKKIEAPFFAKCGKYYLTGRFDAVLINETASFAQISDNARTSAPAKIEITNPSAICNATLAQSENPSPNTIQPSSVQIFDWKTQNLPKDPENDIQTTVYLYVANKLYNTQNLSITYVSLSKNESTTINFDTNKDYETKILSIIEKL